MSRGISQGRLLGLVMAILVVTAACGHRIGDEDLLAANGGVAGASRAEGGSVGATPGLPVDEEPVPEGDQTAPSEGQPGRAAPPEPTSPSPSSGAEPTTVASCETPGQTGPILVGSVGNFSGAAGSSLLPTARTLQTWAQWVNSRGGICGRRLQIIVVDDHSDPAQYRAALQDLVENRGVVAFVNAASLTGDAGIEYLESVRVPEVGGSTQLEALWDSPMVFKILARPPVTYFAGARTAAMFGPPSKKAAIITCREVEVCGSAARRELMERNGAKEAGINVVYTTESSIAQPDYTAECRGAQASGAEVILLLLDAASVRRFGQSCTRQGYDPVYSQISATVTWESKDFPGLSNLLASVGTFPFIANSSPAHKEFQEAIAQFHNGKPGPGESVGWASAKLLELVLNLAATNAKSITPATLIDALNTLENETLGGLIAPVTYPKGRPGIYQSCWFALKASGGEWTELNDGQAMCRQ